MAGANVNAIGCYQRSHIYDCVGVGQTPNNHRSLGLHCFPDYEEGKLSMSNDGFWDSPEGRACRTMWRELTTARGVVATRPRAKGSGGVAQERALIAAAAEEFERAYRGGGWPRRRADVALDVWAVSTRDAPQPQNFAKRLLDQLGPARGKPIVYQDDRQVSMLYVRVDEVASADPQIYFAAQRSALIRSEMRRRPGDDDRAELYRDRQRDLDERLEAAEEAIADWRDDTSEIGKKLYAMGRRSQRFYLQASVLHATDHLAQSLINEYASVPPRYPEPFLDLTAEALDRLASMPYAFGLGTLPSRGETEAFEVGVQATVRDRITRFPSLFPTEIPVGVTAFFVPGPDGKDLDNILRQLFLPVLLRQCHLPRELRHPYASLEDDVFAADGSTIGPPHVVFVEGIALKGVPRPPGTVVVALSDGQRHHSWWQKAIDREGDGDQRSYWY
jgi:hypothetical protein